MSASKRARAHSAAEGALPSAAAVPGPAAAADSAEAAAPSDQIARDAALAALFTLPRRPATRSRHTEQSPTSSSSVVAAAAAAPVAAAAAPAPARATAKGKRKHVAVEYERPAANAAKSKSKGKVKTVNDDADAEADEDDDDAMPALEGADDDEPTTSGDQVQAAAAAAAGGGASKNNSSSIGRIPPPAHWQEVYAGIEQMRFRPGGLAFDAPVDTVGCAQLAKPGADDRTRRFHTLVSLMLSSQTKDPVTAQAMSNLHNNPHWPKPGGLTIDNVLAVSDTALDALINKVGFHNRKVIYLKQTAAILKSQHGGDIPATLEGLMALPGVGPKMAHLTMQVAWKNTVGIGVDTHVHRISNRLGWVGKKTTNTPEQTRMALEQWLPRDYWSVINLLLVGFGQKVCLPVNPRCSVCLVNSLCPTGRANLRHDKNPHKFHTIDFKKGDVHTLHEEGLKAVTKVLGTEEPAGAAAAAELQMHSGAGGGAVSEGVKMEDEPEPAAAAAAAAAAEPSVKQESSSVKLEPRSSSSSSSSSPSRGGGGGAAASSSSRHAKGANGNAETPPSSSAAAAAAQPNGSRTASSFLQRKQP